MTKTASQANDARKEAHQAYKAHRAQSLANGATKEEATLAAREAGVWKNAFFSRGGGIFIADVLEVDPPGATPTKDNIRAAYDFKFNSGLTH